MATFWRFLKVNFTFRYRDFERKNREMGDELRSVKTMNDELNRKQRDLIAENDNLNRTVQEMERDNRKLSVEIDHLTMQLKKLQGNIAGGSNVRRDETASMQLGAGSGEEMMKMKYELESKLKDQVNTNKDLEKNLRSLQREMEGMQDSRSLMQSSFNQQKELLMQQIANSVRGDTDRDGHRNSAEWRRMIDESELRFKAELSRIEASKRDQYESMQREKDAMTERFKQEKEDLRRKIFDIEEQLRRKESAWQQGGASGPVHHVTFPGQGSSRHDDGYIEQLRNEKYEMTRNFEREKDRIRTDYDNKINKLKKDNGELEDEARMLKKQKIELEEKVL